MRDATTVAVDLLLVALSQIDDLPPENFAACVTITHAIDHLHGITS